MSLGILPEVGVTETWRWNTDVLQTWNGKESRISIWGRPRVSQSGTFEAVVPEERRELFSILSPLLNLPDVFPLWAWGTGVTAAQTSGNVLVFADTRRMSLADGDFVALVDPETRRTFTSSVSMVQDDRFTLNTPLTLDIDTTWLAVKGMTALLENNLGLAWQRVSGRFEFAMDSWVEPLVQRQNSGASLSTLNSLPILDRVVLANASEQPEFPRTVTDFGGARTIGTRYSNLRFAGRVTYSVNRLDTDDIDYWRLFLDTVRGSWKAFLLPTQREDFTLEAPLTPGASVFTVSEAERDLLLQDFETYQYLRISYSDGTNSDHQITNFSGGGNVTVSPALPNDAKVTNVTRISYMLKTRMADRCEWRHGATRSQLSMNFTTTNDG